ncbi:hypothetical protein L5G28_07745 [Gordonia sp. HY285]|uniref:hypothetical protein n=1 Tax=Gordonia liuliyuniae TaxID=2911517 RepID=UPI001F339BA0|nr:hypothetical protein [Gordonia liuliyuniae]MCF8610054.1 hypothetical protein [Gordonia liuliyuniae]
MRTAAGAARYKQPVGSIIVSRGNKSVNLSNMDDDHIAELLGDTIAHDKNPQVYEAAMSEWMRRKPEPVEPPHPDPWDDGPDPTESDRLFVLAAERDAALERLDGNAHDNDGDFQDDLDRWQVYSAIIDHEEKLAATNKKAADAADGEMVEHTDKDGTAELNVSAAQRKQWAVMEQAEKLSNEEGITYEEALGRVQGLEPEQVRRREAVRRGTELGYRSTSFKGLVDEAHMEYRTEMELKMEEATRGHYIDAKHTHDDKFWEKWNKESKSLFSMTDNEARTYLSPEAKLFLDDVGGRVSKTDLVGMIEDGTLSENFEPESIQVAFSQWRGRHRSQGDYLQ